jgi:hypothetical protein
LGPSAEVKLSLTPAKCHAPARNDLVVDDLFLFAERYKRLLQLAEPR